MNIESILSSRNPSKAEQILSFFEGFPLTILTLDQAGIQGEGREDSDDIIENARSKAHYAHQFANGRWVFADDTGLFIKFLNWLPGAKAARWAGDVSTEEILHYTLMRMREAFDRTAIFKTAVVLISPEGQEFVFEGEVEGTLLEAPRTKPQPKMPYSAIFMPKGHNKVWAEMTTQEENAISHRGKAFAKMKAFLEESLASQKPV
jgi:XTP/dITP diphosphohydrolase